MASLTRWGSQDGKCVSFTFGGCGANENNFGTEEECINQCVSTSKPKRCQPLSDDVSANCVAGPNRWMYEGYRNSCYETEQSRCGVKRILRGFRTLRACEKNCKN
ncbi:boophilin-H2-like [Watersipora subatra]|uniref:boophilin-H2-like n=1 Tax=Watersipora subatra TaxID=2589382 RepID=UPI00355B479E